MKKTNFVETFFNALYTPTSSIDIAMCNVELRIAGGYAVWTIPHPLRGSFRDGVVLYTRGPRLEKAPCVCKALFLLGRAYSIG